jgi:hypothetical protein
MTQLRQDCTFSRTRCALKAHSFARTDKEPADLSRLQVGYCDETGERQIVSPRIARDERRAVHAARNHSQQSIWHLRQIGEVARYQQGAMRRQNAPSAIESTQQPTAPFRVNVDPAVAGPSACAPKVRRFLGSVAQAAIPPCAH